LGLRVGLNLQATEEGAQISTDFCNAKKVVNLSRVAKTKDK